MSRLQGKVALITGAAQGLGRTIAEAYAQEGAAVAVVDVNGELLREVEGGIAGSGRKVISITTDLADRAQAASAVHQTEAALGPVDVLVNNAVWARYQPLGEIDEETIDRMIAIGLKAVLWVTQAAVPAMTKRGSGSIINMSSIAALTGLAYSPAYAAVKAGVDGMTRALAVDLGRHGIRVNAIAPSAIPSPMSRRILDDSGWEGRRRRTPLGRIGEPADIAEAALFLAGDGSAFITGEVLRVDGGYCIGGAIPGVDVALR